MALSVPSTQTVSDNIIAAVEASIGKTIPLLPKSFTRVLAKALAGVFILTYKYGASSLLQQFVAHASFRETTVNGVKLTPLIEWGRLIGVGDPVIATSAELNTTFDVLIDDSSTVPAGTQLVHPPTGIIYITLTPVVLDAFTKNVAVLAVGDPDGNGGAGIQGNREDGDILKWANPKPQLSTVGAEVTSTVTTAADAETEASYRDRIVTRFSSRPQGGAYADYSVWGSEDVGIINIYPYTGAPGEVDVFVEASEASSGSADGIPTPAQLDSVHALIELDASGIAFRRPAGSLVNVQAILREPFDVQVNGLAGPGTGDTADAIAEEAKIVIEAALEDWFRGREPFIVGLSKLPREDRVTVSAVSGVVDEAASSVGATVITVELQKGGVSLDAFALDHGQKAKLNDVLY